MFLIQMSCFFFSDYFNLWVVEVTDTELVDVEHQVWYRELESIAFYCCDSTAKQKTSTTKQAQ